MVLLAKEFIILEVIVVLMLQVIFKFSFFRVSYLRYFSVLEFSKPISFGIGLLASISLVLDFLKSSSNLIIFRSKWA